MEKTEERDPVVLQNQGQKIFGVMHRPANALKTPAVLMCHGLGGHKVGKGRLYVQLAERLSAAGISSLRIDFRGSGDSEGDFSDMTIDSEVSDAMVALNALKNDPRIDTERIAIFGRSFGGVVAVLAAQKMVIIKSLALWAPVFSIDQWKEKWQQLHAAPIEAAQKASLMDIEGLQPGYPFFKQLFALKLSESLRELSKVPMLHIHGEQDEIVNLSHADNFEEVRLHASGESHFKRLPKTDHDFLDRLEREQALEATIDWFKRTLFY
jgi:alpha-beta hydrolase superfamily lysophospholipase